MGAYRFPNQLATVGYGWWQVIVLSEPTLMTMIMSNQLDRIRARVIRGLAEVTTQQVEITDDTHILRDLEIDSLAVMNLILALEEEFDISMPLERVADVETVNDLVVTVASLIEESSQ